ncbi:MAG: hypothetical protein FWF77_00740, partial [Defluviitaleaceae bacterium]|nr:hypothetical protein [Defluviitaleaceae bacterium]
MALLLLPPGLFPLSLFRRMQHALNKKYRHQRKNELRHLEEMEQALQIEAFLRKNTGKTATDAVEDIKTTKNREMQQRIARCKNLIIEALKKAGIYVNSLKLDIREKAPRQRINDGFRRAANAGGKTTASGVGQFLQRRVYSRTYAWWHR